MLVFRTVFAFLLAKLALNVTQSPCVLQGAILYYFMSQIVSGCTVSEFHFDFVFQFDEVLCRNEQHDVLFDFRGQPIPVALREKMFFILLLDGDTHHYTTEDLNK